MIAEEAYALSKSFTNNSIKGITGALAGKNCTIKSATKSDGVTTVIFAWTADDGTEKTTSIQVNDGAKGEIGDKGEVGVGIDNVTINANSHLIVTLTDGSPIDAGLIQGGSGTDDYEDLINRPKIEGVELIGNKTFEDLGIASATDLAQTDGHLQDLADLVGDKANLPMPNESMVDNIEYVDTKVDGLIDDNATGLAKTFSSEKIITTFATLDEVNERIPQYVIMPTATDACAGQVAQFIGTTTSDYTHNYFYECIQTESGYTWKNTSVQAIPVNVSDLTNDSGFITVNTNSLINYYLKTETYSQAEVDEIVGKLNRLTTEIVTELPTENISTTTIYLVKVDETNNYTQHMYIGDSWADLGSTTIDLSGYVSTQQLTTALADYAKSTDLQAHVDNNIVHLTTEDRDNLTNLLLDEHNHANKTILDGILQAQVDNWNEAFTDKHTHDNKTVIDKFTESDDGKVLYNGEEIQGSLYSVPIGTILSYSATTSPVGFLVCDGSEVSKTTYADLFAIIGDTYGTATDTSKFKLPDLRDKFVQGANSNLGTSKDAGLPNVTGQVGYLKAIDDGNYNESISLREGCFKNSKNMTTTPPAQSVRNSTQDTTNRTGTIVFDASKSNAIYGNSDTVQPPSVCLTFIIKALKVSDKYAEEVGALIDDSTTTATNKVYSVNKIMELLTNWQDVTLNEEVNDTVTIKKLKIGNIVYMHTHIAGLRYTGQRGEGKIIFSTNDTDVINTNITGGDKLRGIIDVDDNTNASIVRTTANIDYDPTLGTFRFYCFGEATQQLTNVALYGDFFSIIQK